MKYKFLTQILRFPIYFKRFVWWVGRIIGKAVGKIFGKVWHLIAYLRYRFGFKLRKAGLGQKRSLLTTRAFLQIATLAILLGIAYPHTKLFTTQEIGYDWQHIKISALSQSELNSDQPFDTLEIDQGAPDTPEVIAAWRREVIDPGKNGASTDIAQSDTLTLSVGGRLLVNPTLMPGSQPRTRLTTEDYTVQAGDSIPTIAAEFGVSVNTVLWENNLGANDIIRPGKVLKIPPVSGVRYVVAKGDTVKKISDTFKANPVDIISFNKLTADGGGLVVGATIMVPGGKKPAPPPSAVATAPGRSTRTTVRGVGVALPTGSPGAVQASGFIWPTTAWVVVRGILISPPHTGIDIATNNGSAFGRPTFAAKSGTVKFAGWNSGGYGNLIIIDHGGGFETYYGHHSQIFVSAGQRVEQGQTIGAIGSTGRSTGPHLHFEIRYNSKILNPLDYVRGPASDPAR